MRCFLVVLAVLAGCSHEPKSRLSCDDRNGNPLLTIRTDDKPMFVSRSIVCWSVEVPSEGALP